MEFILSIYFVKTLLPILAIIAGVFVISTKNPIISVFNLIVLYILVAFYLIYIGLTYLGISYIVVYIGAIAILFLFVIMMIDIEVVEKRNNNYLPLLFLLLGGFIFTLKNNLYNLGLVKLKSLSFKNEYLYYDNKNNSEQLFNIKDVLRKNSFKEIINKDVDQETLNNNSNFREELSNYCNINIDINKNSVFDKDFLLNDNIDSVLYIKQNILNSDIWEIDSNIISIVKDSNNYLTIVVDWDSAINKITQISAIGDVLYTLYHSYIYIVSVILLLGMIGAIILTADVYQEMKTINFNKKSSLMSIFYINWWKIKKIKLYFLAFYVFINKIINKIINANVKYSKNYSLPFFFDTLNNNNWHSETIIGNLMYFVITTIIIAMLLLFINSFFSLNVKYLDKGGGFECGFTSFLQTRERFNVIFYRVSLLFLVFDLEIILIYPYPAIFQKNQSISINNVLAFIYILIIGFVYELKEGALNIVKKGRKTEIDKLK